MCLPTILRHSSHYNSKQGTAFLLEAKVQQYPTAKRLNKNTVYVTAHKPFYVKAFFVFFLQYLKPRSIHLTVFNLPVCAQTLSRHVCAEFRYRRPAMNAWTLFY